MGPDRGLPGLTALAVCVVLAGCAPAALRLPEAERATPAAYRNPAVPADLPRPATQWWREFASGELDRLEEAALANNRDYRVAIARVAQANAQARIAEAGIYPVIDAFARQEQFAPEGGPGSVVEGGEFRTANRVRLGLRASYEADVWGKLGYAAESAIALAAASVHNRESVALTLTTDVALAYFEYLSTTERMAIAERGVASRRNSLAAIEKRMSGGDATAMESAAQRVALSIAETAMATNAQRRERAFNRLALLTGVAPPELKLESRKLAGIPFPKTNPGLPAELLCRRPDIRRAEAQLLAAEFDVRSVRANLLPSFALLAEGGLGARYLAGLTGANPIFYLLNATLARTVFDAGRKEQQLELSRARHLELLEQYTGALLTALREVEDALIAVRVTEEAYAARTLAVSSTGGVYRLHERSLEAGAVDRLQLLDSEQRLYAAEDAVEEVLHERARAAIDLFKALGGGSRKPAGDTCTP